jgi:hypothetical protein
MTATSPPPAVKEKPNFTPFQQLPSEWAGLTRLGFSFAAIVD